MAPRTFSDTARAKMADAGTAMPDGSYPIPDKDALRRAIESFGRAKNPDAVKAHIIKRAKALGATDLLPDEWKAGKAFVEMKAEPMTETELDAWLDGKRSRRILAVPFGGPLPGGKAGVDLDGEYFDEDTDLYGRHLWLRRHPERIVDWHHDNDPTDWTKGLELGRMTLDDHPETVAIDDVAYVGRWADFWASAGEKRRALFKTLGAKDIPLYGSSQAVKGESLVVDGHIERWPLIRHTITTSPQNVWAVVPPLKAILDSDLLSFDDVGMAALKAAMLGIEAISDDLRSTLDPPRLEPSADPGEARGDSMTALIDEMRRFTKNLQRFAKQS